MFIKMVKKILRPEDIVALVYVAAFFIIMPMVKNKLPPGLTFTWNKTIFTSPLKIIFLLFFM